MATSNEYNERMTATARELVSRLMPLLTKADDLRIRINNPICGKPGRGFKAARKLRPELARLNSQIACINDEIAAFIRPNAKMSLASAAKRETFLKAAYAEWGA